MSAMKEFLKSFAVGYAVSYLATSAAQTHDEYKAKRDGQMTLEDQFRDELYKLGEVSLSRH